MRKYRLRTDENSDQRIAARKAIYYRYKDAFSGLRWSDACIRSPKPLVDRVNNR